MSGRHRFDHVGITVTDLDPAVAFFTLLGFEVEGRTFLEGHFVDTVIGLADSLVEIVVLRLPEGGTALELSRFVRPGHVAGSAGALSNAVGLRNVTFEVEDLRAVLDALAAVGHPVVGGLAEYEGTWRMAQVRGPEGILVGLAERAGDPSR